MSPEMFVNNNVFPWCFFDFPHTMEPVVRCSKKNYSKGIVWEVHGNTVIFFSLGIKSMYYMVTTCFSLDILSSCPVCENGDIYNHYKATVLAACHSRAQVQVATIWQDICSATGKALDTATCPQRQQCTLSFGGREYIAFPPMQEMNTENIPRETPFHYGSDPSQASGLGPLTVCAWWECGLCSQTYWVSSWLHHFAMYPWGKLLTFCLRAQSILSQYQLFLF